MKMSRWIATFQQVRLRVLLVACAVVVSASLAPSPVLGTQFKGGEAVHVREGVILDDFFAAASDVDFDAHLVGDLFAAGAAITVGDSALIENSVMGAARRIDIGGHILNSARVFAQ